MVPAPKMAATASALGHKEDNDGTTAMVAMVHALLANTLTVDSNTLQLLPYLESWHWSQIISQPELEESQDGVSSANV